ncbi:MAG TPA: sterol desaturase family protein [Myxococcales bacterium]|jgi:sterol desaturase/sphingolipid hydroxylase (fatty acid hydroxylase superfamily)|nr:sterol desaturase family protein [Myxococcales bacterium]
MTTKLRSLLFSPHPLATLSFALPLAALFAWAGSGPRPFSIVPVLGGVLWWTFAEYAFHRWVYHLKALRVIGDPIHLFHHRNVDDPSVWNAGPLLAIPIAVAMAIPVLAVTRDWQTTELVLLGSVAAYLVYECVHHAVHARSYSAGPLAWLQGFHLHHHRNPRRCFGVTNPLWDILFGTFVSRAAWRSQ